MQERSDARSVYHGTGMGMSIVKMLVDKMGGTINISSTKDVGSTFIVTLPFEIAQEEQIQEKLRAVKDIQEYSIEGAHLLLAEDNELNAEIAQILLEDEGAEITLARDGQEAIDIFCGSEPGTFDAILMDVMMPKLDGFSAIKEIRKTKNIPVLMLSARGEEYDKLFGFEIGIDDYVVKPFSPKEVMARVAAITSRVKNNSKTKKEDKYVFEGLEIDMLGRVVVVDGEKKELTPKEYDLLVYLIKNKNIALSREKILNEVWGYDFFGEDRTVDTHVKMLRNSIGKYRDKITTIRGMGYKFEE